MTCARVVPRPDRDRALELMFSRRAKRSVDVKLADIARASAPTGHGQAGRPGHLVAVREEAFELAARDRCAEEPAERAERKLVLDLVDERARVLTAGDPRSWKAHSDAAGTGKVVSLRNLTRCAASHTTPADSSVSATRSHAPRR